MNILDEGEVEASSDPELIDQILNSVDSLLNDGTTIEKLGYTDEFVLDATLIEKASNILNRITHEIVPVVDNYNPTDFGAKIVSC